MKRRPASAARASSAVKMTAEFRRSGGEREGGRNLPGGKLRNLTIGLFKSLRQRTVADT